jgi:hypothetical protein
MTDNASPADQHAARAAAAARNQNLSWIAMVIMAVLCASALVWAASLNVG